MAIFLPQIENENSPLGDRDGLLNIQTISIERDQRSNQSNQIERNRTVEIRLSNAIESQSNITLIFGFD